MEATEQYPTIARLADPANTTVGYQAPELIREAVAIYRALSTAQSEAARVVAWPEEPSLDVLSAMSLCPCNECQAATIIMRRAAYKAMRAAHLSALPATVSKGEEGKA